MNQEEKGEEAICGPWFTAKRPDPRDKNPAIATRDTLLNEGDAALDSFCRVHAPDPPVAAHEPAKLVQTSQSAAPN